MDELRRFVQAQVLPRLKSGEDLLNVVQIAISVIRLILREAGHGKQADSDNVVQECFTLVRNSVSRLVDWIVHAVQRGLSSLKDYLRRNPELLKNLKEPTGKLLAKLAIDTSGKLAAKQGAKALAKLGTRAGVRVAVSTFLNPGIIAADIAQTGFELGGMPKSGRMVGAAGNAVSGAVGGAIIGGPIGAAIGASVSLSFWGIGELVGYTVRSE